VLDNDSQDGSFETLSGAIRGLDDRVPVTVLSSERNGGFAYGVNAGVRHGLSSTSPPSTSTSSTPTRFPIRTR